MLHVTQFTFSLFGVNTYLVYDEATKDAAVIDPAMNDDEEKARFDKYVEEHGLHLTQIINTHMHLDHCFGESHVITKYGVPVKADPAEAHLGRSMSSQFQKFGMSGGKNVEIDVALADGDIIDIGESKLQVISVPGHSAGGIALYYPEGKLLISGDSLFRGSVGRTDLLGGDHEQLIDSIRKKLYVLPDDTTVLPGHGGHTTIGYEKKYNPFTH